MVESVPAGRIRETPMSARFQTVLPAVGRLAAAVAVTLAAGTFGTAGVAQAAPAGQAAGSKAGDDNATVVSFQATTPGLTDRYIRHLNFDGVISNVTKLSSSADKKDATWIVRTGLADSFCVSLESKNVPGRYLRHSSLHLVLQPPDGTKLFREDATFCPRQGKNGTGVSFESVNYPDRYIRHYQNVLYLASNGGPNLFDIPMQWANDVSWQVAQPWAP